MERQEIEERESVLEYLRLKREKEYENKKFNPSSTHPHQIYLEIISEVGLLGLIYFIFIFLYPIFISLKSIMINNQVNVISHLLLH